MKGRYIVGVLVLVLLSTSFTYAQGKRRAISKAVDAAVSKRVVTPKVPKMPKAPKVPAGRVPAAAGKNPVPSVTAVAAQAGKMPRVQAATQLTKPHVETKKFAVEGHPLTRLLPTAYLYEDGQDYGKITEYLINEAMDRVAADATAWDVRKETHQLFQSALGSVPKFLYTHDAVNDMLDVFSLEQFMLKNGGDFPLTFAQAAAQDGMGAQMTSFLVKRYLLGVTGIVQVQEYLWNLYAKAPNARSMEEIVSDVEAFVAKNNRLPGIVYFAGSDQVAPVMRSAMHMSPEELALGTEMLLVTHVADWGWMTLPEGLSPRIRALYNQVQTAVKSWRGDNPFVRTAVAPNL